MSFGFTPSVLGKKRWTRKRGDKKRRDGADDL